MDAVRVDYAAGAVEAAVLGASHARPDEAGEQAKLAAVALNAARLDEAQAREEVESIH